MQRSCLLRQSAAPHLLLAGVTPDAEAQRLCSAEEGALLANVVAANHKEGAGLGCIGLLHGSHEFGDGIPLQQRCSMLQSNRDDLGDDITQGQQGQRRSGLSVLDTISCTMSRTQQTRLLSS